MARPDDMRSPVELNAWKEAKAYLPFLGTPTQWLDNWIGHMHSQTDHTAQFWVLFRKQMKPFICGCDVYMNMHFEMVYGELTGKAHVLHAKGLRFHSTYVHDCVKYSQVDLCWPIMQEKFTGGLTLSTSTWWPFTNTNQGWPCFWDPTRLRKLSPPGQGSTLNLSNQRMLDVLFLST